MVLEPVVRGDYPFSMRSLAREQLPFFTDKEQEKLVHYPRSGHHCRFKNPLHCRILNRQWHTGSDGGWHHYRFLKTDTDLQATVSVPGNTRQCLVEQHCRFVVPTDSDGCFKSVGSWLKPTVLSKPTLSVYGSTGSVDLDNTVG